MRIVVELDVCGSNAVRMGIAPEVGLGLLRVVGDQFTETPREREGAIDAEMAAILIESNAIALVGACLS